MSCHNKEFDYLYIMFISIHGRVKILYIAPTPCFKLLDGAAIFLETSELIVKRRSIDANNSSLRAEA